MLSHILAGHVIGNLFGGGSSNRPDTEGQTLTGAPGAFGPTGPSQDTSVFDAIKKLEEKINKITLSTGQWGQLTNDDLVALMESAADGGKLTRQEWAQIKNFIHANRDRMSPQTQQLWDKVERMMDKLMARATGSAAVDISGQGVHQPVLQNQDLIQFFIELRQEASKGSIVVTPNRLTDLLDDIDVDVVWEALQSVDGFDPEG
jgi:hypothetical protein